MSKLALKSKILIPKDGEQFAFHVFTPALVYRLENPCDLPVMALRSSLDNYQSMVLFHEINVLGPSSLKPLFDEPLPGTNGRGVAIMFTESPMQVWYPVSQRPAKIKTKDGSNPKAILEIVIQKYVKQITKAKRSVRVKS